jgi:phage replication-related protein YjqB (UPF0714/DUF867 family)
MGQAGRERLGTPDELDGVIDSQVPHPTLSDAEAEEFGEFVERLRDDGRSTTLIAIGPHGGDIERHTDQQAERVASRLAAHRASSWICKGYKPGGSAFDSWHVTSDDIDPRSFPLLGSVTSRGFTDAIGFHGFDEPLILVGGLAPTALKEEIRAAIADAVGPGVMVRVATPDDPFNGESPRNIVNRLTAGGANGIQIEQSPLARSGNNWAAVADAVAAVYDRTLPVPAPS